jgi:hypothetical protein
MIDRLRCFTLGTIRNREIVSAAKKNTPNQIIADNVSKAGWT